MGGIPQRAEKPRRQELTGGIYGGMRALVRK
jgi:hypothetical protein